MTEQDPYLNEIFESRDPRDGGKRIRVIEKAPATRFYDAGYRYRRVDEFGQFAGRANRVHITAATLDKSYRKVSR
jgi:hypothetical protein